MGNNSSKTCEINIEVESVENIRAKAIKTSNVNQQILDQMDAFAEMEQQEAKEQGMTTIECEYMLKEYWKNVYDMYGTCKR
jgi:hypothetical protein